ncbi:MAG TPA: hypothetical protein VHA33_16100 [Candidatus Angelobacter sp.]|jgi:hypothetical protein|nr:hypothetical protein [Candidatus Angelobacter sp.]
MAFPFLQRVNLADCARQLNLLSYAPFIVLENLVPGIDNIRHDVFLSPKFSELAKQYIFKLIAKHGNVEALVDDATFSASAPIRPAARILGPSGSLPARTSDLGEFKKILTDLHIASLNRAKSENNVSLDLLFRLAILKFQRVELTHQYSQVLDRSRAKVKTLEGPRQAHPARALELRDRFAKFQINKKAVLRRAGQDLFFIAREVEKESLNKTRRSLFGDLAAAAYDLFLNRLVFTEDGRDDYLNAEHYVMLGNYERDPDRFQTMQEIACQFLQSLGLGGDDGEELKALLSVPENAQEMMGGGAPDDSTPKGKNQRALLNAWVDLLERENVLDNVIASYEVVPLLGQYSPPINPQQLKNALISRTERKRVEALLEEQGKISPDNLHAAEKKVEGCKGGERAKVAGRFFGDFIRYHRDFRRMEALLSAIDSVNIINNDRFRELSAINNTLYEFVLPEEQKRSEDKVIHHIILKADIRESTTLTRTLMEQGLNPASYFSLNFYDPINKLLPKYDAQKVFIEGDAIILALFEREGESGLGVARTCVLAKEMIEIVTGYNERSRNSGLPSLELGLGISYQDSAPLYLMDGTHQIMISKALNESDRLSSCSKGIRRTLEHLDLKFSVFAFKTVEDDHTGGNPDEFLLRYNIGGIHISEAAFDKLQTEISLQAHDLELPLIWDQRRVRLYSGVVPIGQGLFHKIVVREGLIAHIDARDFALKRFTDRRYYEVCTNEEIYKAVERSQRAVVSTI